MTEIPKQKWWNFYDWLGEDRTQLLTDKEKVEYQNTILVTEQLERFKFVTKFYPRDYFEANMATLTSCSICESQNEMSIVNSPIPENENLNL